MTEGSVTVICPSCRHENPAAAKFCSDCGTRLPRACAQCGAALPESGKFCAECGAAVLSGAGPPAPGPDTQVPMSDTRGERRQLTVLFCDLVGSTELSARLDPEEMGEVLRVYYERVDDVVRRFDGYVAQHLGDGVLAYFGYPRAHEDDPVRAISAALGLVVDAPALNARAREQVPRLGDYAVAARMAVHTGLVVVGEFGSGSSREEHSIVGDVPNVAARLQTIAEPNTVVISDATRRLVAGVFVFEDLGPRELKGVPEPVHAFRALRASGVRSRLDLADANTLTPLIGRQQQVALLLDSWEQVQDGQGQVVLLSGDAGMGKSRLVQVLHESLADQAHSWLEGRCSPYHESSALHPIIELIEQGLLFRREDDLSDKMTRLENALRYGGLSVAENLPLFTTLLSLPLPDSCEPLVLSAEAQRQRTLDALLTWFFTLSAAQPMILVIEDLHWVDPSTLDLLGMLIEQVPTARVLLLFTFRPNFRAPWTIRSHLTQLTLNPLRRRQVEVMVTAIAKKPLPEAIVTELTVRADGVPLFVEEMTKAVLESGSLRDAGGSYELSGPLPSLQIPATLQDSLMARLDRLGPTKEVAQTAAVLGREFSYERIARLSSLAEERLREGLAKLVEAELLYQRGVPPETTYTFKNTLIQEAAYHSLLKKAREQYHARAAAMFEEHFPDVAVAEPELVAHHLTAAGLADRAVPYWTRAGERATARSANMEAVHHFRRALDLLPAQPMTPEAAERELALRIAVAVPLQLVNGYGAPDVEATYARARELCQRLGEAPQIFPVLHGLWRFYVVRGPLTTAAELAASLMQMAEATNDATLLAHAGWAAGGTAFWLGHLHAARGYTERSIAAYDEALHPATALVYGSDPKVTALCYLSLALWLLGHPDAAVQRVHEAAALAEHLAHPFSLAWAADMTAVVHHWRGEDDLAAEWAQRGVDLATEQRFALWQALAMLVRGRVRREGGTPENEIAPLQEAMLGLAKSGQVVAGTYFLSLLSDVHRRAGDAESGAQMLESAFALVEQNHERFYEAELLRSKGESLLHRWGNDAVEAAEECFRRARAVARVQAARSLELRAATSLARLLRAQGRNVEARDLLAPAYAAFTEGFETSDLVEARSLLAELGA